MISNQTGAVRQQTSSEHAGRPRAVAAVMLLASLGPVILLVFGVADSLTNPWGVMTIWFAAAGLLVISLPLTAVAVGILRRSVVARWIGIAVSVLGSVGAVAAILMLTLANGVPQGDAWFFSLMLAMAAGLGAFMTWALVTTPDYFKPADNPNARMVRRQS